MQKQKYKKKLHNAIDTKVAQCYNHYRKRGEHDMINTNKIKGRLAELGLTQKDVSKALNIAQPTANQKINNVRPMDLNEAEKLAILLQITPAQFNEYFFI